MRPAKLRISIGVIVALLAMASTAWSAVTGSIAGTVTDAESGKPLSGVYVSSTEGGLEAESDAEGVFFIGNVPPGTYTLTTLLVGYAELTVSEVTVTQGQETRVPIRLTSTVSQVAGAKVRAVAPPVTLHQDITGPVSTVTRADEQVVLSQPNDRYQFTGLVFSQPGVVPDNTFYPHIRGGRANAVGYFLDGIPITEPNANVFATNVVSIGLAKLELFTGSYPIEYSGYTGGVINEVVKRGRQVKGGAVDVGAGTPYDFGGLVVERGDQDGKADWYYGLNSWHTRLPENLFTSAAPTVSDHIGKVVYDAGKGNTFTLLSHHGYARYLFPFERQFTFDPDLGQWVFVQPGDDFGRQGYDIDSLALNHEVSREAFWNLRFSRVAHFLQLDLGDPGNAFWQHRNERMFVGQFDYDRRMGDHHLRGGLWEISSDNNSRFSVFGTQFSPFGLLDSIANNDTQNTQSYLEDKWQVTDRLLLALGGRYDRMSYARPQAGDATLAQSTVRSGATYVLTPRLLLRGAAGSYVGFPRANLIAAHYVPHASEDPAFADAGLTWDLLNFPSFPLRPQLDREREVGLDWKVGPETLVTAAMFWRRSHQMMQKWQGVVHDAAGNIVLDANGKPITSFDLQDFDPDAPVWFAANGTGRASGVELKADRKLAHGTRAWLSYTYLDARATSAADNLFPFGYGFLNRTDPASLAQEFPVDWDQRHTAVLALHHELGKLTVDPWAVYGSGFPYGQSGLDVGGSDPAHVPNPDFNPDDPTSPAELVVPQNYVDPNDPSKGFITPNSLNTGANFTLSLNLGYEIGPRRQAYLQIYNLLGRDDITSFVIYHPRTGAILGTVAGDTVRYVPFSRTPPRFFAFGIRQEF